MTHSKGRIPFIGVGSSESQSRNSHIREDIFPCLSPKGLEQKDRMTHLKGRSPVVMVKSSETQAEDGMFEGRISNPFDERVIKLARVWLYTLL